MTTAVRESTEQSLSLPVHLSHFIGRSREVADLLALLGTTRMLTLTGCGGSGKTRLAGAVASDAGARWARTAWVDIAPLSDGSLVATQIANALHVTERSGVPALDCIIEELGENKLLLVIDNCEHVIDDCAVVIEALLRRCPGLTILATSREALSISSETAWLVPPMVTAEAVQLFVERASTALPTFRLSDQTETAVAEICRRLDGLPLAIELAAARVRVLAPAAIAERLDDAFKLLNAGSRTALPRHRTLRGTMDWSYQLLVSREQLLLQRLSVFAGSFSLDAAESVCADDELASEDILDGVAALVDKSMVVMEARETEARYHLLETVRQYAAEHLGTGDALAALQARHAAHFLAHIERIEPFLVGGDEEQGLVVTLHLDTENYRAALAWTRADDSRAEYGLRFAGSLFWYWYSLGQFVEAKAAVDEALDRGGENGDPIVLGKALLSRGLIALAQGDTVETRGYLSRANALFNAHGSRGSDAFTTRVKWAASYVVEGDPQTATHHLLQLEADARASLHSSAMSFWLFWRGWAALLLGDLKTARRFLEEDIIHGRKNRSETTIAHGTALLGRVALSEGNIPEAVGYLREGLTRHRMMGESWGLSLTLSGLATVASVRGDHSTALRLQGGVDALRERVGLGIPDSDRADGERLLAAARAAFGERFDALYQAGRSLSREALADLALRRVQPEPSEDLGVTGAFAAVNVPIDSAAAAPRVQALRIEALGGLQVFRGDALLDASSWGSARPRELLIFLLLHPDGVTKEQVGLAFWPEASASQLRNSFHVTLHRLRKVLGGAGTVIAANDRYRVAPAALGSFDVPLFEREVTAARQALKRGEADASAALEEALRRYRGDLLDGEPAGDWHQPFRDQLRSLFLDAALELGALQMREERYQRAVDTFRRVLARDDMHEGAVRALMTCQVRLGERAQALRTYERVVSLLRKELEAEPEAETIALAARIQQGAGI